MRRTFLAIALCGACSLPNDADMQPPQVVNSIPVLNASEVYPAPIRENEGEEVKLELSFSAPMRQEGDLLLTGGDTALAPEAQWSDERKDLDLIVRPAFSGLHPLADGTEYSLDLAPLQNDAGKRLEPDEGLIDRRFVFTTGRYDALLNHACQHTFFGPFADIAAGGSQDATAPDVGATHTQYKVLLTGEADARWGWLRARFVSAGQYRVYFDDQTPIAMAESARADPQPLSLGPTPAACPGITHEITFTVAEGDERFFLVGPRATPMLHVIVERVTS